MSDYIFGIKELDDWIGGIKTGSNIMIIGPPMTGKGFILNYIMYHGAAINGNAVTTVTTHESAPHVLEWFKEQKLDLPLDRIGIIDCISKISGYEVTENENIKIASNPVDLTGIGVKISQLFEEFSRKKNIPTIQLHINSVSTILMYSNIQTVFRFLHVFTGRIKSIGGIGIYLLEGGMHDEKAIATLKQLFDAVIEIESKNDKNFIRVVGLSSKPTPWFEYEIEGAKLKIIGK